MPSHPSESPAKKQSKWSPEEDAIIIDLRGSGMKWEDISKRLPGRSAISCRLHYQNYLERRSEWDDERKNKLARLYERFKPEMWAKVAEELAVPWRAAEAMHWQLGETDMARRAGVVPFALNPDSSAPGSRPHPNTPGLRGPGHTHSHSHSSPPSYAGPPPPPPPPSVGYGSPHSQHLHLHPHQGQQQRSMHTRSTPGAGAPARSIAARRDSMPRSAAPTTTVESLTLAGIQSPMMSLGDRGGNSGGNVHGHGQGRGLSGSGGQMLPGVLEMTTRVSPYSTPAFSVSSSLSGGSYTGPGSLPAIGGYREAGLGRGLPPLPEGRRSGSEEAGGPRESLRRRRQQDGGYE